MFIRENARKHHCRKRSSRPQSMCCIAPFAIEKRTRRTQIYDQRCCRKSNCWTVTPWLSIWAHAVSRTKKSGHLLSNDTISHEMRRDTQRAARCGDCGTPYRTPWQGRDKDIEEVVQRKWDDDWERLREQILWRNNASYCMKSLSHAASHPKKIDVPVEMQHACWNATQDAKSWAE